MLTVNKRTPEWPLFSEEAYIGGCCGVYRVWSKHTAQWVRPYDSLAGGIGTTL